MHKGVLEIATYKCILPQRKPGIKQPAFFRANKKACKSIIYRLLYLFELVSRAPTYVSIVEKSTKTDGIESTVAVLFRLGDF